MVYPAQAEAWMVPRESWSLAVSGVVNGRSLRFFVVVPSEVLTLAQHN